MDSGNSGSIQSSSGGDDEYDSRAESISSFLSPSTSTFTFPSHPHHHPSPPSSSSSSFDPMISTYLDAFARPLPPPPATANPLLNLDILWSRGLRSSSDHPNCTDLGGVAASASLPPYASMTTTAVQLHTSPLPSPSSSLHQPTVAPSEHIPTAARGGGPPRSSKKRSRASRRAPTTVLTTDTSNFRAMVQEFTGIPSPPFAAASPAFPRPRLDLFRAAVSAAGARPDATSDAGMPGYVLKPFAQKVPVAAFGPFASGSSSSSPSAPSVAAVAVATGNVSITAAATTAAASGGANVNASITRTATAATASIASISTTTTTAGSSHQLPSALGHGSQTANLLNAFSFQSLLHAPNRGIEKAPQLLISPTMSSAAAAGYAIGGGGGGRRPSLAVSEGMSTLRGGGSAGGVDVLPWVEGSGRTDGAEQGQFRPAGGIYGDPPQRGSSCKLNCTGSAASSEYRPEKVPENVSSRGEGMVDSWICSSD